MRQRLPFNLESFGRVPRLLQRVGNDESDRVADVAHLVLRQHRMRRRPDVDAVDPGLHRQRPEACRVAAGEHQAHARHCMQFGAHLAGVEREAGVGMRRTHHNRVQ